MNNLLLLLLLFPAVWPFISKLIWKHEITWGEVAINLFGVIVLVIGVWYAGTYSKTHDTEILNGEITGKKRDHGFYVITYPCNCRTVNNVTTCSTCTQNHYTVTWNGFSTVGTITFEHLDSLYPAVYASPDPSSYVRCKTGEPASLEHSYENYVKGAPESLFNMSQLMSKTPVPKYPSVYDFYKINRVIDVDKTTPQNILVELNEKLNDELKKLGKKKEVNIIVIFTKNPSQQYRHVVENNWIGGKKNDVVVFVSHDNGKIQWVDVMTFGLNKGNEMFRVTLRDHILEMKELKKSDDLVKIITTDIEKGFKRTDMKNYEYLKSQIDPPTWAIVLAILLAIGGSIGLSWYLANNDVREWTGLGRRYY